MEIIEEYLVFQAVEHFKEMAPVFWVVHFIKVRVSF